MTDVCFLGSDSYTESKSMKKSERLIESEDKHLSC